MDGQVPTLPPATKPMIHERISGSTPASPVRKLARLPPARHRRRPASHQEAETGAAASSLKPRMPAAMPDPERLDARNEGRT